MIGKRSHTSDSHPNERHVVEVVNVRLPFWSLVVLMVKIFSASIVASFLVGLLFYLLASLMAMLLGADSMREWLPGNVWQI